MIVFEVLLCLCNMFMICLMLIWVVSMKMIFRNTEVNWVTQRTHCLSVISLFVCFQFLRLVFCIWHLICHIFYDKLMFWINHQSVKNKNSCSCVTGGSDSKNSLLSRKEKWPPSQWLYKLKSLVDPDKFHTFQQFKKERTWMFPYKDLIHTRWRAAQESRPATR